MTYDIYSIGDANFLAGVLNAVAALGGSGKYASLMSISLLIGIIFTAIKAIYSQKFELQNFLVAVVMYQVMFGVQARVVVNDVYTGGAQTVDNVPWGLAFVGSVMSSIGYDLTEEMETAFSTPKMSADGFGGALAMILNARRISSFGPADYGCASQVTSAPTPTEARCSLTKSLENYVRDCVGPAYQAGMLSPDVVENAPQKKSTSDASAFGVMRVPAEGWTTNIFIGSEDAHNGRAVSCRVAYDEISSRIFIALQSDQFKSFVASRTGASSYDSFDSAVSAFGDSQLQAQSFVLNQAIRGAYTRGVYLSQTDQNAAALMMSQEENQRAVQFAAEASIFARLVRPMMTFFEAFFYATAPFMVFLIGLGPMGLSLVGKYLYLPIWVSLWQPVMAIINFYVNYIAESRLSAFDTVEPTTFISLNGSLTAFTTMQDWLSTASNLAASVPAITGFLLYGGSQAFTALSAKLGRGDFVNEKIPSPDPIQPAPAIAAQSGFTSSVVGGTSVTGVDNALPQIGTAFGLSQQIQSQSSQVSAASERQGQTFQSTFTDSWKNATTAQERTALLRALQGASSDQVSSNIDSARSYLKGLGMSEDRANEALGQTLASAGVSAGVSGSILPGVNLGANAGISTSAAESDRTGLSASQRSQLEEKLLAKTGANTTADLVKRVGRDLTQEKAQAFTKDKGGANSEALMRDVSRVEEERRQLGVLQSASTDQRFTSNLGASTFAEMVKRDGDKTGANEFIDSKLREQSTSNPEFANAYSRAYSGLMRYGGPAFVGNESGMKAFAFMQASAEMSQRNPGDGSYADNTTGVLERLGIAPATQFDPMKYGSADARNDATGSELFTQANKVSNEAEKLSGAAVTDMDADRNRAATGTVPGALANANTQLTSSGVTNSPTAQFEAGTKEVVAAGAAAERIVNEPMREYAKDAINSRDFSKLNEVPNASKAVGQAEAIRNSAGSALREFAGIGPNGPRYNPSGTFQSNFRTLDEKSQDAVVDKVAERLNQSGYTKGTAELAARAYLDPSPVNQANLQYALANDYAQREYGAPYTSIRDPGQRASVDRLSSSTAEIISSSASAGELGTTSLAAVSAYMMSTSTRQSGDPSAPLDAPVPTYANEEPAIDPAPAKNFRIRGQ